MRNVVSGNKYFDPRRPEEYAKDTSYKEKIWDGISYIHLLGGEMARVKVIKDG